MTSCKITEAMKVKVATRILEDLARVASTSNNPEQAGLIELSQLASTINSELNLPKSERFSSSNIGVLLEQISKRSYQDNGIMLSALVVRHYGDKPGSGFYKLARDLGYSPVPVPEIPEHYEFWKRRCNEVWDFYRDKDESKSKG